MKKTISWALTIALAVSLLCVPSVAVATTADTANENATYAAGTVLLEDLLHRQFESLKTGQLFDTSDIFTSSQSTDLYREYLRWYIGLTDATQEYWTDYNFDMQCVSVNGDEMTFSANLSYGRTCSKYNSVQPEFLYTIRLGEYDGKYYIVEIDTEEANFHDFKGLLNSAPVTFTADGPQNAVDALIADYVSFKAESNYVDINQSEVIDMEQAYSDYLSTDGGSIDARATSYSYNGERGRRYADTYYKTANSCFKEESLDCTNFVSQCIWAAYGGWSDGDSAETMDANIAARKRMQSSASLDNWFAHKNGTGNPWASVGNLWTFVTGSPATGPKATGVNNNAKYSNIACTSIVTGNVLQFRNGSSGDYGHSVYVSGGTNDSYANIKINQHTNNAQRQLDEVIRGWGSDNCNMRQLKFTSANFDR